MNIIQTNFKYRSPLVPLSPDKVAYIIIHHPAAVTVTPERIHEWHLQRDNGTWKGFGYNEYITKDGTVYIGRGDHVGAQCLNMNSKSYGICCEGNYDKEQTMPEAQFKSLIERLKYHQPRFKNLIGIVPHKQLQATSCPGKYFPLDKILNALKPKTALENAIDILALHGVLGDKELWLKNAKEVKNLDYLIINMARKLKGE